MIKVMLIAVVMVIYSILFSVQETLELNPLISYRPTDTSSKRFFAYSCEL
jgi:hypothetical protein